MEPDHKVYYVMDIATGESSPLLTHATESIAEAAFSADGQSVVFRFRRRLMAAPVRSSPVDEKDWTLIAPNQATYQWPAFSPDGAYLYDASNEDGHVCIYAQRVGAALRPSGPAVALAHLHEGNILRRPVGMQVGADKITLLLNQGTSNVWMTQVGR
jgi:hypothetical protein